MVVPFDWIDKAIGMGNLGQAEFVVCVKFKRGKLAKFWIYPVQTRLINCWHWEGTYDDFSINADQGLSGNGAHLIRWCKEHKTFSCRVYAPAESKFLKISHGGLSFYKEEPK